jgi:hypothetical protein
MKVLTLVPLNQSCFILAPPNSKDILINTPFYLGTNLNTVLKQGGGTPKIWGYSHQNQGDTT